MRKVNISSMFELSMVESNPTILYLQYRTGFRNPSHQMEMLTFLETLPVLFTPSSFTYLSGALHPFYGCLGFVTDENKQSEKFLSHLVYSYYDTLKADLERINSSYVFEKKAGKTLQDFPYYLKEATKDMTTQEVISKIAPLNETISLDDFSAFFLPTCKEEGTYVLPWSNFEKVPAIFSYVKEKNRPFPAYSLKNHYREILLYVLNDTFFFIKCSKEGIQSTTFSLNETEKVAKEIEAFFPLRDETNYAYANEIIVEPFTEQTWQKMIETTASYVGNVSSVSDDLTELRPFFQKEYGIKARKRDDLWNKGIEQLIKEPFHLDFPMFSSMSNHLKQEPVETARNRAILDNLDNLKTKIQLSSFEKSGIYDTSNEQNTKLYSIVGKNNKLFMIPDYGKMATTAPSFSDIIDKTKVKP